MTDTSPPAELDGPRLAANGSIWTPSQSPVLIGSAPSNKIVIANLAAVHAVLVFVHGGWRLRPIGANPVRLDDAEVQDAPIVGPGTVALRHHGAPTFSVALVHGNSTEPAHDATAPIDFGDRATQVLGPNPRPAAPQPSSDATPPRPLQPSGPVTRPPDGAIIRIGRAAENDVVVPDLLASRRHAELRWETDHWRLLDLGSANGSFVDGQRIGIGDVEFGQRLTIGNKSYWVTPSGLDPVQVGPGATDADGNPLPPALEARRLSVEVDGGTRILNDVSFSVQPGEVLAIVGPSGAGKSTLLKALTGSRRPEYGSVTVRGSDLYESFDELCHSVGYVPQDDILHLPLTVRQALTYGAELRFPPDTTADDHRERVDEVLAELELSERADVPVENVSGGQRKRTSVALELLTRPDLLFLDEPTSGLDPGFERTVMELLRELASAGRAVVVVTHSLQSLHLCDNVLFLQPGGSVAFLGSPDDALAHFGKEDYVEVFRALEAAPRPQPTTPTEAEQHEARRRKKNLPPTAPASLPWGRQIRALARRQLAILKADRQNLMFMVGSVIAPSILILILLGADALDLDQSEFVLPQQLLGAIVVAAVAIGAANSIREIVKELPIYLRERATGIRRSAYLASKLLVLGALTTVQVVVLVFITTLRSGGPGRANLLLIPHLELIFDVAMTGLAAVALGLLLSTVVSSSEKAMALVPVVFVVQWLFSGAALDLQSKPVMREVAQLTAANWGMAASASSVGQHELSGTCSWLEKPENEGRAYESIEEQFRLEAAPKCDARWRSEPMPWLTSILALGVLTAAPMYAADRLLARKEPLESQRKFDWPGPWYHGPRRQF